MQRSALVVLSVLLLLAALALWFTTRSFAPPQSPQDAPGTGAAAAPAATAAPAGPATGTVERTPDREAAATNQPADLPVAVAGVVLADPRSPDLTTMRVVAYAGQPEDARNVMLGGMSSGRGRIREPGFVLSGKPVASALVAANGRFELHAAERHLRITIEHELYVLPLPEIVHRPADHPAPDLVLAPLLGGCIRGRVLGDARDAETKVSLVYELDPMTVMRDSRLFLGTIVAGKRPGVPPEADGSFVFRGVLPGSALVLAASGPKGTGRCTEAALSPGETREVALPLRAAASLEVLVVDAAGAPVAKAGVGVRSALVNGTTAPQLLEQHGATGEDGRCRIEGLPAERSSVEASAKGRTGATTELELQPGADNRVQLTVQDGGVVTGVVRGPDGAPVADAGVAHQPSSDLPMMGDMTSQLGSDVLSAIANEGVRTDAEGRFRLTGLADEGEFCVVAAHEGFAAGVVRGVKMGAVGVEVKLQTLGSVAGKAVAADDQHPLDTFSVALLRTSFLVLRTPVRQASIEKSADGTFALADVPPGAYTLQVSAEGRSDVLKDVEVKSAPLDVGAIALPRAASIAGTVKDEAGAPVPFALVRRRQGAMADNPMMAMFGGTSQSAYTDAQGHFRLAPLGPGKVQLLASAQGFASGRSERVPLEAGQQLEGVEILLGHGGSIRGRLVLGAGQQPDDFLLFVQEQGSQGTKTANVAADGTFVATDLDPGNYTVQAMPQGLMRAFGQQNWKPGQGMKFGNAFQKLTDHVVSQRCAVRAGETTEVVLDASEVAFGLRWTVRVEVGGKTAGSGLVEAVELDSGSVRVAMLQQGSAVFTGLHGGVHRVQVRSGMTMAPLGQPQEVTLPANATEHQSTLSLPGGELHGRVVDATSGEPLRSALVRLLHDGRAGDDDPLGMALTDEHGGFAFDGLAEGNYGLLAVDGVLGSREGTASRRDGIHVVPGQPGEPIELRAAPAATARAMVTTANGAPLAGATVLCVDAEGRPFGALGIATSGPDGRAVFGGMPRGQARVVGRAPGYAPAASELQDVSPDRPVEFALSLPTGARTTLSVFDKQGRPLASAAVTARCNGGPWLPTLLLVQGRTGEGGFDLGRLGAGSWEFQVVHPTVGTLRQQRTIGAEANVTVVIAEK